MVRLGIPCERLLDAEFSHQEILQQYDLICLSAPAGSWPEIAAALDAYVNEGGTLIVESLGGRKLATLKDARNVTIPGPSGASSPVPAMHKTRAGKGTVYHGRDYSFRSMKGNIALDPLLDCIVLDAVAGRCRPVYAKLQYHYENTGRLYFHDDAMREELGTAWDVEHDGFTCTGSKADHNPLALRGTTGAMMRVVVSPHWEDYRLAVSVLPGTGRGGLWVTLSDGDRLTLMLDGATGILRLVRRGGSRAETLAERRVASYEGWRKLSLFCRDSVAYGFLDADPLIRVDLSGSLRTAGFAGLAVEYGSVFFDDVTARGTEELVLGTDRAPMEEGSCFARPDLVETAIEMRHIHSRQWYLKPAHGPSDTTIRVGLPNYTPATLTIDGAEIAHVSPSLKCAAITLAGLRPPSRDIAFICSGWRDYAFTTRVTDWYWTGAPWTYRPRWSCDPHWEWLGTDTRTKEGNSTSTLWYKKTLSAPYAVNALMAIGDSGTYGQDERSGRDLNLVLGGNGRDFDGAYVFRVMRAGKRGCELWRDGCLLASIPRIGLPYGHPLHHVWFNVRAVVEPQCIRLFFEEREVICHRPADPVSPGHVGLWTENNAVLVARATISMASESGVARGQPSSTPQECPLSDPQSPGHN